MHRVDVVIATSTAPAPALVVPDHTWTHAELNDYASQRGIDLGGARTKADKLAALAAP